MNRYLQYNTAVLVQSRIDSTRLYSHRPFRYPSILYMVWSLYLPFNPMYIMANPTLPYPRQTGTFYD